QVAGRLNRQAQPAVTPELVQHVVQEAVACADPLRRLRSQVKADPDVGLVRGTVNVCLSLTHAATPVARVASFSSSRKSTFSAGRPALTRRQPSRPGRWSCRRTRMPPASSL